MIDPFPLYMFYSCEDPARAASFFLFFFVFFGFFLQYADYAGFPNKQ